MASWTDFANAAPVLAAEIRAALHQYGAGLAYLATIRPDGGPRIHPVSPAVTEAGLFCCLLDGPKRRDLDRDGRYALHAFPADDSDDEATIRGSARLVTDPVTIRRMATQLRADMSVRWFLYDMRIDTAIFIRRAEQTRLIWADPRLVGPMRPHIEPARPHPPRSIHGGVSREDVDTRQCRLIS